MSGDPLQGLACPQCQGSGQLSCDLCILEGGVRWIECRECDGEGQYECDACICGIPHDAVCTKCRGDGGHECNACVDGSLPCPECEGSGQLRRVRDSQDAAQLAIEVAP